MKKLLINLFIGLCLVGGAGPAMAVDQVSVYLELFMATETFTTMAYDNYNQKKKQLEGVLTADPRNGHLERIQLKYNDDLCIFFVYGHNFLVARGDSYTINKTIKLPLKLKGVVPKQLLKQLTNKQYQVTAMDRANLVTISGRKLDIKRLPEGVVLQLFYDYEPDLGALLNQSSYDVSALRAQMSQTSKRRQQERKEAKAAQEKADSERIAQRIAAQKQQRIELAAEQRAAAKRKRQTAYIEKQRLLKQQQAAAARQLQAAEAERLAAKAAQQKELQQQQAAAAKMQSFSQKIDRIEQLGQVEVSMSVRREAAQELYKKRQVRRLQEQLSNEREHQLEVLYAERSLAPPRARTYRDPQGYDSATKPAINSNGNWPVQPPWMSQADIEKIATEKAMQIVKETLDKERKLRAEEDRRRRVAAAKATALLKAKEAELVKLAALEKVRVLLPKSPPQSATIASKAPSIALAKAKGPKRLRLDVARVFQTPEIDAYPEEEVWGQLEYQEIPVYGPSSVKSVFLKVAHDGDFCYFFMRWKDRSQSVTDKIWVWDQAKGEYQESGDREDRVSFMFPMIDSQDFEPCMLSGKPIKADLWSWFAGRTNGAGDGYADDGTMEVLIADPADASWQHHQDSLGKNIWIRIGEDRGRAPYRVNTPTTYKWDKVPHYVPQSPSGSRADVEAYGFWLNGEWMLELRRRLDTLRPDEDIAFELGRSYVGAIAVFNQEDKQDHDRSDTLEFVFAE